MNEPRIIKREEADITLKDTGVVHIAEVSDGFNIDISQYISHSLRIGIPFRDGKGTLYTYWEDVVKTMQEAMTKGE